MADNIDVVVVGSLNVDATMTVDSIPGPGETVMGGDVRTFLGGKGFNQAVAAALAGARVAMIGRLGDDDGGHRLRNRLEHHGIDHTHVTVDTAAPSGMAFIAVDRNSENAIVVSPGANNTLTPEHVDQAGDLLRQAAVVLLQFEVPIDTVTAAARTATGSVILNPAPARPLPAELLSLTTVLIPNRSELATITGEDEPIAVDGAVALARHLVPDSSKAGGGVDRARTPSGPATAIVTLGSDGALVVDPIATTMHPAPTVTAVDTTGAGDCFCGSLAARLALGHGLDAAVDYAIAAAALSVTRPGASDSMPTAADVASFRR